MIRIIALGVVCVTACAQAQVTNGLVGWFPLEGDATNHASSAVQQGGTPSENGNLDPYWFGVNGREGVLFCPLSNSVFTVSIHVYDEPAESDVCYLSTGFYGPGGYTSSITDLITRGAFGVSGEIGSVTNVLIYNHWVHYVFVSDSNRVSLYANGALIGSKGDIATQPGGPNWYLGAHGIIDSPGISGTTAFFGFFRDCKIYDRVLNDAEIHELFNEAEPPNNILACYQFAGTTYNEVPLGGGGFRGGQAFQAANLLGGTMLRPDHVTVNGGIVEIPFSYPSDIADGTLPAPWTVSLHVYEWGQTNVTSGDYLSERGSASIDSPFHHILGHAYFDGGDKVWCFDGSLVAPINGSWIRATWAHYVLLDNTNGMSLYLNGTLIGSSHITISLQGNLYLGGYANDVRTQWGTNLPSVTPQMIGCFRDVKVFGRALSQDQIQELFVDELDYQPSAPTLAIGLQPLANTSTYNAVLHFMSQSAVTYQLQASRDMHSWTSDATWTVMGNGGEFWFRPIVTNGACFFRLLVVVL